MRGQKGTSPPCSVDGCERPMHARGWCSLHYQRWQTTGNPKTSRSKSDPRVSAAPIERFMAKTAWSENHHDGTRCLEWKGHTSDNGYGLFSRPGPGEKPDRRSHRWLYERWIGPIPDGLQLDHLCRNRACVNPAHLEPVTNSENTRRGLLGVLRTHCKHGHLLDEANTHVNGHGHRTCRTCARDYSRERRAARRRAS